jgi:hypothetical protein
LGDLRFSERSCRLVVDEQGVFSSEQINTYIWFITFTQENQDFIPADQARQAFIPVDQVLPKPLNVFLIW